MTPPPRDPEESLAAIKSLIERIDQQLDSWRDSDVTKIGVYASPEDWRDMVAFLRVTDLVARDARDTAAMDWCDQDQPLPDDAAIKAVHPLKSGRFREHDEAMRLVGAKRSKGALVDLVTRLLVEKAASEGAAIRLRSTHIAQLRAKLDANARERTAIEKTLREMAQAATR